MSLDREDCLNECERCELIADLERAHCNGVRRGNGEDLCRTCIAACAAEGCEDCQEQVEDWTRDEWAKA